MLRPALLYSWHARSVAVNTPAHVVVSAVALGRGRWHGLWGPITLGALLPDLPMFGFYAYQRLMRGRAEAAIWGELYFDPDWQLFFDLFNSFPLLAVAGAIAWRLGDARSLALVASMTLHCLFDLPLHHDDAHAHFEPLTSWRFESPLSYWDPAHYGRVVAALELAGTLVGAFLLTQRGGAWRTLGLLCGALYAAFIVFALAVWL